MSVRENLIRVPLKGKAFLEGDLQLPKGSKGLVIFAHGSGSSRHSVRNRFVADVLQEGKLGTLLIDLLSNQEEMSDLFRFDIPFLTERLSVITQWALKEGRKIGYFGASTGAAAALCAAAKHPQEIGAVVSRGGRPDLALAALEMVRAPTLLIVGGDDSGVIEMNQEAFQRLHCKKEMVIIPGATHLFEESGTLEEVARYAREWFNTFL